MHSLPAEHQMTPKEQSAVRQFHALIEQVRRSRVVCMPQMSAPSIANSSHNNGRTLNSQQTLFVSRFGGPYAWPNGNGSLAPPTNDYFCLLQLNLSDLQVSTPEIASTLSLPESGLLQFFIRADPSYGMDDETFRGTGFEVVYHDAISTAQWQQRCPCVKADLLPLGSRANELLGTGVPIASFAQQDDVPPSHNDYRLEKTTLSLFWDPQQQCRAASSAAFEQWYEENIIPLDHETSEAVAWVGGHPRWSQGDIRTQYPDDSFEALLSLTSDGEIFQWGDMGDATFLIRTEDLRNRRFSNMLYSWDCF